ARIRAARRCAALGRAAEADPRFHLASMGWRDSPLHERSGCVARRASRDALLRASRRELGQALLAARRRDLRRVFPLSRGDAAARRRAEGDWGGAIAFSSRAPLAARNPGTARGRWRAV